MLDNVLGDCFHEGIVADGLYEYRAVIVARRGCYVQLEHETQAFLQHPVMNVLDTLEPGQPAVMNVVCLVVEYGEFIDLPYDLAEVGIAAGRFACRLIAEGSQKIVPKIIVVERGFGHVAEIDAMNVCQKDIADRTDDADIILNV